MIWVFNIHEFVNLGEMYNFVPGPPNLLYTPIAPKHTHTHMNAHEHTCMDTKTHEHTHTEKGLFEKKEPREKEDEKVQWLSEHGQNPCYEWNLLYETHCFT